MKIAEIAERTGLARSTIRFYEHSRLCPPVARGPDGNRDFSTTDLDWLMLLSSLRATGMPTSDMHSFAELYRHGNKTIPERKAALLRHRNSLEDRQAELEGCRDILNQKLAKYDEILGEKA